VVVELEEYLLKLKERVEEWERRLEIAKTLIEAREKAGIPSLAVWSRYHQLYARVQALKKAVEEALAKMGRE